jgi:hypothetical protein
MLTQRQAGRVMKDKHELVIRRLETIVAELECEFLYLLNDLYAEGSSQGQPLRTTVANLRMARYFLSVAANEVHNREPALMAAE